MKYITPSEGDTEWREADQHRCQPMQLSSCAKPAASPKGKRRAPHSEKLANPSTCDHQRSGLIVVQAVAQEGRIHVYDPKGRPEGRPQHQRSTAVNDTVGPTSATAAALWGGHGGRSGGGGGQHGGGRGVSFVEREPKQFCAEMVVPPLALQLEGTAPAQREREQGPQQEPAVAVEAVEALRMQCEQRAQRTQLTFASEAAVRMARRDEKTGPARKRKAAARAVAKADLRDGKITNKQYNDQAADINRLEYALGVPLAAARADTEGPWG